MATLSKSKVRKYSKSFTTFDRYTSTLEKDSDTIQYVVDKDGKLHDLSGNIEAKLQSVDKSRKHWETKLIQDPSNLSAKRFLDKFNNLYEQILMFLESDKIVSKV